MCKLQDTFKQLIRMNTRLDKGLYNMLSFVSVVDKYYPSKCTHFYDFIHRGTVQTLLSSIYCQLF